MFIIIEWSGKNMNITTGMRLNDLIIEKGVTADYVAKQLNISKATISDIINDVDKGYSYKYFVKIAKYFDVSVDYLLGLTDVATTDKDLQYICDYTGLNEQVVTIFNSIFANNNYYGFSLRFNEACKKNPNLPQITANKILSSRFFLNLIDFMIIQESLNSDIASCLNLIERNADYNECSKYINLCDEQDLNIYRAQTDVFELLKSKMNYNSDDLIKIKSYIYDKSIENELK